MLNKEKILKILNKYNLDKTKFIVISGAAMVLLGIKEETNDIDIATTKDYYNYLLNNYNCKFEISNYNNINVYYIDNIINFSYDYYSYENIIIDGVRVQSIEELINLKKGLNREKDQKDLELISKFIKKNTK